MTVREAVAGRPFTLHWNYGDPVVVIRITPPVWQVRPILGSYGASKDRYEYGA